MANEEVFINRPTPRPTEVPWKEPADPQNPIVRGLPLYYGAIAISKLKLVQSFLWANAGFSKLSDLPEVKDVEPRYDPTVIRSTGLPAQAPEKDEEFWKNLLAEDWQAKISPSKPFYSILDYHQAYKSGHITPTAVAKKLLPLIRRDVEKPSKHSTAFLQVREDLVLKAAAASTQRYQDGKPLSPMDGVPVAVKDEVDVTGYKKCLGSKLDFTRADDATSFCVQKWQDAGAVLMGKTNMHELGMDTTNNNPNYGTPLNPYNDNYYCGGSSGGSAYVVAAGLMPVCEGNDGGGSVRIPANYCGLYGLKTSHGRVSQRPSLNLARSTGVCGPIAANMCDLEIGYRTMATPDDHDPDSALFAPPTPISLSSPRPKLLGIYDPWLARSSAPVKASVQALITHLTTHESYTPIPITLPHLPLGQLAHALTILSEISTGTPPPDIPSLTPANKVLLSVARHTPAETFLQAQRLRTLLMQHLAHLYTTHPGLIVLTPTTPNAGWRIAPGDLAHGVTDGNQQIRNMEYVWLANFSGCPALSAPCGFTDDDEGVPMGVMGMAEWGREDDLLAFGYDCERFVRERGEGERGRPRNWVDVLGAARREAEGDVGV